LEAGRKFDQPIGGSNLVVLTVSSQAELRFAIDQIEAAGIRCVVFHEPDDDLGDTAACTEPLEAAQRRIFRQWGLWLEGDGSNKQRGPPR
jgi:hypothetical protein